MPTIAPPSPKTAASTLHTHSPAPLAVGDRIGEVAVVQVAAGAEHGVALLASGAVVVWGNRRLSRCRVPAPVGRVAAVAASDHHTVLLGIDGRVWAVGQLRRGGVEVPAELPRAVAIAAGSSDAGNWTAALLADGGVRVWGVECNAPPWPIEPQHRLEFLRTSFRAMSREFAAAAIETRFGGAIREGVLQEHAWVALLADGSVAVGSRKMPLMPAAPADLGPVRAVAMTMWHIFALCEDGSVRCWNGTYGRPWALPRELVDVVAIAAGRHHALALLRNGRVLHLSQFWPVEAPAELQGRAVAIHADGESSWAVDCDGRLHAWGCTDEVDSLPFDLTDEAWLEFATRFEIETKQRIFPARLRRTEQFKAIRTLRKLARG